MYLIIYVSNNYNIDSLDRAGFVNNFGDVAVLDCAQAERPGIASSIPVFCQSVTGKYKGPRMAKSASNR